MRCGQCLVGLVCQSGLGEAVPVAYPLFLWGLGSTGRTMERPLPEEVGKNELGNRSSHQPEHLHTPTVKLTSTDLAKLKSLFSIFSFLPPLPHQTCSSFKEL